jgi:hypothetical protein
LVAVAELGSLHDALIFRLAPAHRRAHLRELALLSSGCWRRLVTKPGNQIINPLIRRP